MNTTSESTEDIAADYTVDWFGIAGSHLWAYSHGEAATAIAFLNNLKNQLANTDDGTVYSKRFNERS